MEGSAPDPNQALPEWGQPSFDDCVKFMHQKAGTQVPLFNFFTLNL